MTIPSLQEFDQAIRALVDGCRTTRLLETNNIVRSHPSYDEAKQALLAFLANDETELKSVAQSEGALRWFWGNRTVEIAWEMLARNLVDASHSEIAREGLEELRRIRPDPKSMKMHMWVDDFAAWAVMSRDFRHHWALGCLAALREYHYEPTAVNEVIVQRRLIEQLREEALKGIEARRKLETIAHASFTLIGPQPTSTQRILDNEASKIQRRYHEARVGIAPIFRNDGTAPERLLIYRLWRLHKSLFAGQAKVAAIIEMMGMDGIRKELDIRNIEKTCAAYSKHVQARGIGYFRRLFAHLERSTAPALDDKPNEAERHGAKSYAF
ncbi:hypothetical protein [Achromobacter marplatensis]|uniref:Uncharacterized protein n=1 Tax=Achromobacter marplatensis TaxID=470868 RepID=A0AA42WFA4_9BURK|nr:hypothetical protein [Achromobacter marplatensis]MDH2052554.1 hypothetical protein [Achromobacter marplatensis]